jgi:hypothetical protein
MPQPDLIFEMPTDVKTKSLNDRLLNQARPGQLVSGGMDAWTSRADLCRLIETNTAWLRQALAIVEHVDDTVYATSPLGMAPHRVGSHLRHVIEFYQCFLDGLEFGRVDYDSRKRNEAIEKDRALAVTNICSIIYRLEGVSLLRKDTPFAVRMEDAEADVWLASSIGRELQSLSSHTIHHFALIAVTLHLHGVAVDPDFGMSPSTLRYQAAKSREAA